MIKELMSWKSSDNAISLSAIEQASLLFIRNIYQKDVKTAEWQ